MKISRFFILISILSASLLAGCIGRKCCDPGPTSFYPEDLVFHVTKDGTSLSDSILSRVRLSYFQNGTKQYSSSLRLGFNDSSVNSGVMIASIGFISANDGVKNFYLEYPDTDVDTILADYRNESGEDAIRNSCRCTVPLAELRFNDRVPELDSFYWAKKVYAFEK